MNHNKTMLFEGVNETTQKVKSSADLFSLGTIGGLDNNSEIFAPEETDKMLLGSICWWSINGVDVPYAKYVDLMVRAGIPSEWLHPQHTWREALMQSLNDLHTSQDWPIGVKKITLGTIDGNKPAVHALMYTEVDKDNKRVHVRQIGTTFFNNVTGKLEVNWDAVDFTQIKVNPAEIEHEIRQGIEHHVSHFSTADVRANVLDILLHRVDGFRVRPKGGIYFVPACYHKVIDALDEVIREVSREDMVMGMAEAGMFHLDVLDSAKAKSTLMVSYGRFLESEINRLSEGLTNAEKGERNIRSNTLHERLNELKNLKARAQRYADLFDMQVERINNSLSEVGNRIVTLLSEGA